MLYDQKKAYFFAQNVLQAESLKAVQRAYQAKYKCKSALFLRSKNTIRSLGQQKTRKEVKKHSKR